MDFHPSNDELSEMTGVHTSARKLALEILEEALVPAASKIKAMICDQDDIVRAKFDTCRYVIDLFFGRSGIERKSDNTDWESALSQILEKKE